MTYFCYHTTPLGKLIFQSREQHLCGAWFENQTTQPKHLGQPDSEQPVFKQAIEQLSDYFSGSRKLFDVPTLAHGTEFQQRVWQALRTIPYGETWTYGQLAVAIGQPTAARAVGLANSKNPLSIIVPCHRVVGSNGKLTGYAGGVRRKAMLLALEASTPLHPADARESQR